MEVPYAFSIEPEDSDYRKNDLRVWIEKTILEKRHIFAFSKVSSSSVQLMQLFQREGFCVVDNNVTFEISGVTCKGTIPESTRIECLDARETDQKDIEKIAEESFIFSRFHLDPLIENQVANRIKREWVGNFFKQERRSDDRCFD